eukprot:626610-Rhodomonas_salina.2
MRTQPSCCTDSSAAVCCWWQRRFTPLVKESGGRGKEQQRVPLLCCVRKGLARPFTGNHKINSRKEGEWRKRKRERPRGGDERGQEDDRRSDVRILSVWNRVATTGNAADARHVSTIGEGAVAGSADKDENKKRQANARLAGIHRSVSTKGDGTNARPAEEDRTMSTAGYGDSGTSIETKTKVLRQTLPEDSTSPGTSTTADTIRACAWLHS